MKLYTKPGVCSTADHIALQWTGQPYEVEVMTAETLKSPRYLAINPTGAVPAVVDGDFLLTRTPPSWATSPTATPLQVSAAMAARNSVRWPRVGWRS